MASSKIRIRLGQVEIEYEGDHAYLNDDLPKLLSTLVELRKQAGAHDVDDEPEAGEQEKAKKGSKGRISGSVSDTAAQMNAKSGPDLIMAAAVQLTLVEGKSTFTRDELLTAIQSATSYYKKTFSNNLSKYLKGLVLGRRLTEPSTNTYALSAAEKGTQEKNLAG